MNNFILIIIEGQDMPTLKANFAYSFYGFLKDNFEFEVKNSIIYVIDKNTENEVAELKSIVYELTNYYMLLISIPIDIAEKILDEEFYNKLKDDSIYIVPPLKVIAFIFNRENFLVTLNTLALNSIKFYRDNYENQNRKLVLDNFPLIIHYEKEYDIPVAVYNEIHNFEKYINRFVNEI